MAAGGKSRTSQSAQAGAPRAWQRMLSGRRLDLLDPSPLDIEIEDIAHGLARVARWNGQTHGEHAFSVAQHSVLVEHIVARQWPAASPRRSTRRAAARCAGICDRRHDLAVQGGAGCRLSAIRGSARSSDTSPLRPAAAYVAEGGGAREAARIRPAAFFEATRLAGFDIDEALRFFGAPPPGGEPDMTPLSPTEAQALFLTRFASLMAAAMLQEGKAARLMAIWVSSLAMAPGTGRQTQARAHRQPAQPL